MILNLLIRSVGLSRLNVYYAVTVDVFVLYF